MVVSGLCHRRILHEILIRYYRNPAKNFPYYGVTHCGLGVFDRNLAKVLRDYGLMGSDLGAMDCNLAKMLPDYGGGSVWTLPQADLHDDFGEMMPQESNERRVDRRAT